MRCKFNKRELKIILILLPLAFLLILGALQYFKKAKFEDFGKQIIFCNNVNKNFRFSCYLNAISKYYGNNLPSLVADIKTRKDIKFEDSFDIQQGVSYAVFGTNCHTFYHAVGDFIQTHSQTPLAEKISMCSSACTSGCVMGLYKRTALEGQFNEELLKSYYNLCPSDSKHQCAHEIGHNLHDKYTYSILKPIDEISSKQYQLNYARNYNYTTLKDPNLNAPFDDCKKLVPESELAYCYTGIGHNLFLFSEFSPNGYRSGFQECEAVDPSHKNDCYDFLIYRVGINHVAPMFLSDKAGQGSQICDEVVTLSKNPDLKHHCYLGVGGGIGLFIDSEYADLELNDNNFTQTQKQVSAELDLCGKVESDFQDDCYRGLLGTPVKNLYKKLNLKNYIIEELLPKINNGFQVVG